MKSWDEMRGSRPSLYAPARTRLVYAEKRLAPDSPKENRPPDRERLKEQLAPFIREMVQKVLKEEREYYKSRPSLAAKHYGGILPGSSTDAVYITEVAGRVYGQIEDRLRLEWIRKGRG